MVAVFAEIFILSHNPFHWRKLWNCPFKSLHFRFWLWRNYKRESLHSQICYYLHFQGIPPEKQQNKTCQVKTCSNTAFNAVKNTWYVWKYIQIFEWFQEVMKIPLNRHHYFKSMVFPKLVFPSHTLILLQCLEPGCIYPRPEFHSLRQKTSKTTKVPSVFFTFCLPWSVALLLTGSPALSHTRSNLSSLSKTGRAKIVKAAPN